MGDPYVQLIFDHVHDTPRDETVAYTPDIQALPTEWQKWLVTSDTRGKVTVRDSHGNVRGVAWWRDGKLREHVGDVPSTDWKSLAPVLAGYRKRREADGSTAVDDGMPIIPPLLRRILNQVFWSGMTVIFWGIVLLIVGGLVALVVSALMGNPLPCSRTSDCPRGYCSGNSCVGR
jgi:hypothetical protein